MISCQSTAQREFENALSYLTHFRLVHLFLEGETPIQMFYKKMDDRGILVNPKVLTGEEMN